MAFCVEPNSPQKPSSLNSSTISFLCACVADMSVVSYTGRSTLYGTVQFNLNRIIVPLHSVYPARSHTNEANNCLQESAHPGTLTNRTKPANQRLCERTVA